MTKEIVLLKNLLAMNPKERVKFISENDNSGELVKQLPPNDAWLTIKTVGAQDAIPVIKKLSPEQLQHVTDIELWKKDELNEHNVLEWLKILGECGKKKLFEFIDKCDPLTVGIIVKDMVYIEKKRDSEDNPMEREWPGELTPITFDGVYFMQAKSKEAEENVIPLLRLIAENDYERFASFCETIIMESKSTMEENAYEWRQKRLADEGFVPFEEAIHVYAILSERQMQNLPKREKFKFSPDRAQTLRAIMVPTGKDAFLKQALEEISDQNILDLLQLEFFSIANRALIADAREITPEEIENALRKTFELIEKGLKHLSGDDPSKGAKILTEHFARSVFQVGFTLARSAKKKTSV